MKSCKKTHVDCGSLCTTSWPRRSPSPPFKGRGFVADMAGTPRLCRRAAGMAEVPRQATPGIDKPQLKAMPVTLWWWEILGPSREGSKPTVKSNRIENSAKTCENVRQRCSYFSGNIGVYSQTSCTDPNLISSNVMINTAWFPFFSESSCKPPSTVRFAEATGFSNHPRFPLVGAWNFGRVELRGLVGIHSSAWPSHEKSHRHWHRVFKKLTISTWHRSWYQLIQSSVADVVFFHLSSHDLRMLAGSFPYSKLSSRNHFQQCKIIGDDTAVQRFNPVKSCGWGLEPIIDII